MAHPLTRVSYRIDTRDYMAKLDRHALDQAQRLMTVLNATLLPHLPSPSRYRESIELEIEDESIDDYNAIERSHWHISLWLITVETWG